MKVLGLTRGTGWKELDGPQYYRLYLPLREMNRADNGIEAEIVGDEQLAGATDEELGGRDVYVMARLYHEACDEFIDKIHSMGGVLVLDTDDDFTETYRLISGRGREFKSVLSKVDFVTVSTQYIAEIYALFTKRRPLVLENRIDTDWMIEIASKAKRVVEGFTLGFSGSPTHWQDWYLPAVPFAHIARDYPYVTPLVHGEMPSYMRYASDRLVELGGVPFSMYPMLLNQFDALLCGVDSRDEFNMGKSNIKALECMALGVLPICSQFQPYMDLADAGAPVVIIEDESRDGWYEAIRRVVIDDDYTADLRGRGPAWVRANMDMRVSGHKSWTRVYRSFV